MPSNDDAAATEREPSSRGGLAPSALRAGAVHVWYTRTDVALDPLLLHDYRLLLSPAERDRWRRFRSWRGRREYLFARALVRTVLSRYAGIDPRLWTFREGEHGRPEIAGPPIGRRLRFNLSHTDGLIVCAVAEECEVGVDVEAWDRPRTSLKIADRFFSPAEAAALRALPPAAQRARFLEYWTLKESYIKARGLGFAIPLERCAFTIDADRSIHVRFVPPLGDEPGAWRFALLAPTPRHCVALALRVGDGASQPAIELRETVPLRS